MNGFSPEVFEIEHKGCDAIDRKQRKVHSENSQSQFKAGLALCDKVTEVDGRSTKASKDDENRTLSQSFQGPRMKD